ncbi:MAG: hypothetical protein Q7S29_03635 [Candidatus Peribacter sp.]|nr:hypothetical protein [Candidatus Peribacter sp.]
MLSILSRFLIRIRKRARKSFDWLKGWFHAHVTLKWLCWTHQPLRDLALFQRRIPFIERREYSQNGEDGIIAAIFAKIGTTNRSFVEFGVEDGLQCNCRYLLKHKGWKGLLMDGGKWPDENGVRQEFVTAENIELLLQKYGVPPEFDLLSIDIDGNDYWVWKAITHFHPRVVIMEYNANKGPDASVTIPYDSAFRWDGSDYQGASLRALEKLGREKGYTLVATDRCGVNAFFVSAPLVPGNFSPPSFAQIFHPAAYKGIPGKGHPADPKGRPWVTI